MSVNPKGEEIVDLPNNEDASILELRSLYDHYYELESSELEDFDSVIEIKSKVT